MATVKIVYTGLVVDEIRPGMNIPRVFLPTSSYIDTPVFTQGYENKDGVGDGQSYGKSIYATNVDGWGKLFGLLPMASATGKFAQFERAIMKAFKAEKEGTDNEGVTFEVEGYEDELYWNQIAANMVELGFYIEVGDEKYGEAPKASEGGSEGGSESGSEGGEDSGN